MSVALATKNALAAAAHCSLTDGGDETAGPGEMRFLA